MQTLPAAAASRRGADGSFPSPVWTTDLALFEDGKRVDTGQPGIFEWWYFDAAFNDGSTCVVNFYVANENGTETPTLQFNISPADGSPYLQAVVQQPNYASDPNKCDVVMGRNWVSGDLQMYTLHAEAETADNGAIAADLTFTQVVRGFRIGPYLPPPVAATIPLGEQVVIPSGSVSGSLTYNGATYQVFGTCYHDHQWGTSSQGLGLSKWYWGRTGDGDHSVVFAQMIGTDGNPQSILWHYSGLGGATTFDLGVDALTVSGDPTDGMTVVYQSALGTVTVELPSPTVIAHFPTTTDYTRYFSLATVIVDYNGDSFSGTFPAIFEQQVFQTR